MHSTNLLWTPSITSHEIFGKTNNFDVSNFTHPNAQSEVQTNVFCLKSTHLRTLIKVFEHAGND